MTSLHPDQASPALAEREFAFLENLGFRQVERWVSGGETTERCWVAEVGSMATCSRLTSLQQSSRKLRRP